MQHRPLRYAYFTGCVAKGTCPELHRSTVALCQKLGIELWEMTGATCCGAGVIRDENPELQAALNARTLAMAEQQGMDIVNVCATCQQNLGHDAQALRASPDLRARAGALLTPSGLVGSSPLAGTVRVKHLLWALVADYGLERLAEQVTNPLTGLRVAPFYGCHLLRPPDETGFDDPDHPTSFDSLITALGATPVDYAGKTRCCGFHILAYEEDTATAMAVRRLEEAAAAGADLMVTASPLCHLALDAYQPRARKLHDAAGQMPVLHLAQLVGLACGLAPRALQLQRNVVSPRRALAMVSPE
jgi:succinate dehydrogenase / fumarate reductase cytochrome b subunit